MCRDILCCDALSTRRRPLSQKQSPETHHQCFVVPPKWQGIVYEQFYLMLDSYHFYETFILLTNNDIDKYFESYSL